MHVLKCFLQTVSELARESATEEDFVLFNTSVGGSFQLSKRTAIMILWKHPLVGRDRLHYLNRNLPM
jgi:hypothetical protein